MERTINKRLVEEVRRVATLPLNLEEDLFEPEEPSYEVVDPNTIEELTDFSDAESTYEGREFTQIIQDILDSVTPRESKVLKLRFGIGVTEEYTLEQIASVYDLTRESIRQIEAKVLRKMRHPSRSEKLRAYIYADTEAPSLAMLKQLPPKMDEFWGIEGMQQYEEAIKEWQIETASARAKLAEARAKLKKGTLV